MFLNSLFVFLQNTLFLKFQLLFGILIIEILCIDAYITPEFFIRREHKFDPSQIALVKSFLTVTHNH